jgi:phospholipase/lecithinase/hemolysin
LTLGGKLPGVFLSQTGWCDMDETLAAFTDPTHPTAPGETYVAYVNARLNVADQVVIVTVRNRQGVQTTMEMSPKEWQQFIMEAAANTIKNWT